MLKKEIFLNRFPNKYERILKKKFKNINFSKRVNNTTNAIISFNRQCFDELFESFDFDKMVNLKWIHIPFSGIEKYQKFKLIKNINFTSSRNIQSSHVAEHSIAILLSITRKIDFLSKNGIDKKFDSFPTEIKGKKVLIFGYGAVGKEIKKKITSFKPKISIFTNKTIKKPSLVYKIYSFKKIYKAIKENQIIFFCIPLKEENISIISLKALNCIKKGSVVVSVSREEIFDLVALKKIIKKNI